MKEPQYRFPAYGHGGDHVGARRGRRAFRLCVLGMLVLTGALWVGERFLRYDLAESKYLSALTLPPQSARPLLRSAVKDDTAEREFPTPRYLEALAEREEEDQVLPTYAQAQRVDPDNSSLAIRYGCRLFLEGRYTEARAQFAQAATNAPKNALPMYLEAAVIPWQAEASSGQAKPDIAGSLALIARANSSGNVVAFPKPLWHAALPQQGVCYAALRRQIVDECCAPLYRYRDYVIGVARNQIDEGEVQYWDSWLETVETMGRNIANSSLPTQDTAGPPLAGAALSAQTGLEMQLSAVTEREHIRAIEKVATDDTLAARRVALKDALAKLHEFENTRDDRIAASRLACGFPIGLVGRMVALLLVLWIVFVVLARIARGGAAARSITYPRWCKVMFGGGAIFLLLLLALMGWAQGLSLGTVFFRFAIGLLWWAAVAGWLGIGLVFPALVLPKAEEVCGSMTPDIDYQRALREARRCRVASYVVLIRRYYGVLLGLALSVACVWTIGYRVVTSIYPFQFELLVSGLAQEEYDVVQAVLSALH